jgi:hypothetical protein
MTRKALVAVAAVGFMSAPFVGAGAAFAATGASTTYNFQFTAPSPDESCSEVGMTLPNLIPFPSFPVALPTAIDDNIPFNSWNGIPLLGLIDGNHQVNQLQTVPGADCGDTTAGSSASGLTGSTGTSTPSGQPGELEVVSSVANTALSLGGVSDYSQTYGEIGMNGSPAQFDGSGATSVTEEYSYDVASAAPASLADSVIASREAPVLNSFEVCVQGTTQIGATESSDGDGSASAGNHTVTDTWTCPAGWQLIASAPTLVYDVFGDIYGGPSASGAMDIDIIAGPATITVVS